jgi:small subunit ribosomal protein S2
LPGAVVVIDAKKEYLSLREARKLNIVTIGILDTDSDPDTVDVAIPANDDSIRAIELLLNELADAVAIGKTMVAARQEPAQRPRRMRSKRPVLARASREEPQAVPIVEQKPIQNAEPASQQAQIEQPESNSSDASPQ